MNSEERYESELPKHMPVDMAIAPDQKPYNHTYIIHTPKDEQQQNKLAQHSLSPEKLGVVGYVKDVAGFVKDVVNDRREKRQHKQQEQQQIERRNSDSSVHSANAIEDNNAPRRNSTNSNPHNTPFIDAVTGLFPGVNTAATAGGCTHADELRNQMMQVNEQQEVIHKHK